MSVVDLVPLAKVLVLPVRWTRLSLIEELRSIFQKAYAGLEISARRRACGACASFLSYMNELKDSHARCHAMLRSFHRGDCSARRFSLWFVGWLVINRRFVGKPRSQHPAVCLRTALECSKVHLINYLISNIHAAVPHRFRRFLVTLVSIRIRLAIPSFRGVTARRALRLQKLVSLSPQRSIAVRQITHSKVACGEKR